MASITVPSDYIGKFEITQNPREQQKLQGYIDTYENQYMMELLGVKLFDDYLVGISLTPIPDPLFVKIKEPFAEDVDGCFYRDLKILVSKGVNEMLLGFIYWEFYKDDFSKASINGKGKSTPENSTNSSTFLAGIYERYNESLTTYRSIQSYVNKNIVDYQNFNGTKKLLANWF